MKNENFMQLALMEARKAAALDEVPVGAIIVKDGIVLAAAHNLREQLQDPLAHAEVLAIQEAARKLGSWRLIDCDLYVTLEPCPMCLGAAINSRIRRIAFGASDPKAGACGSVLNFAAHPALNHSIEIVSGILANECALLLSDFFKAKRRGVLP